MKGKRIAALGLTVALTLSLLVLPAGAVSFTDMRGHWAQEDVEYLAGLGIVNGTSATTFSPARQMTACEALLFCSRTTGVSAGDKARIAASWAEELGQILPQSVYGWAAEEMAVCLETGIISTQELEAMCTSGALLKAITRENLSMYLVRAMQLEPVAKNLTSYSMSYTDTNAIAEVLKPYAYLLSTYGIIQGNSQNQFMPKGYLTRAEMATMLRRAIDFTDAQGIYAELPAYTTYPWVGGTISSVSTDSSGTTVMVLSSNLSGVSTQTLPAGTPIYENNMRTTTAALRTGQYVRVNLDGAGRAQSARLGGTLTALTGTVSTIDQGSISLVADGTSRRLDIDRFTKVQVDQKVGGQELIDPAAGYTQVQCWVDGMGHLAELKLSGGTATTVQGVLQSITYGTPTILVVQTDQGQTAVYQLDLATMPTIRRDGVESTLDKLSNGDRLTITTRGGQVSQIQAFSQTTPNRDTQLSGTLLVADSRTNTMALQLPDGSVVTADVSVASLMTSGGATVGLNDLLPGNRLQLYGQYSGAQFAATLVIKL